MTRKELYGSCHQLLHGSSGSWDFFGLVLTQILLVALSHLSIEVGQDGAHNTLHTLDAWSSITVTSQRHG